MTRVVGGWMRRTAVWLLGGDGPGSGRDLEAGDRTAVVRLRNGLLLCLVLLVGRLFTVQVLNHESYAADANRLHEVARSTPPPRGAILDALGDPLALTLSTVTLYADPSLLGDAARRVEIAERLDPLCSLDREELVRRLLRPGSYVVLERKISEADRILAIGEFLDRHRIRGIGANRVTRRSYPLGRRAVHVVGFVGDEDPRGVDRGLAGLELAFDESLRGLGGCEHLRRDARQRPFYAPGLPALSSDPGMDVHLSLDTFLQEVLYESLRAAIDKHAAAGGAGVVLDPSDGRVLAMVSLPDFAPEEVASSSEDERLNRAVGAVYPPGSAFKPFVLAAALETGVVRPGEPIDCEDGLFDYQGRPIRDNDRAFGRITVEDVLIRSSNIGMAKIGLRLGMRRMFEMEKALDLDRPTGIDLPGEGGGIVRPLVSWTEKYTLLSQSFGQEIAVTPLGLARAFCVFANGGKLVTPRLVDRVVTASGRVFRPPLAPARRVFDPKAVEHVRRTLVQVVEHPEGTGRVARLDGWKMAAKTGTAQLMRKGAEPEHVSWFVGFAPADDARLLALVVVDRPTRGGYYGGTVAGPAVAQVLGEGLDYLLGPASSKQKKEEGS